MKTIYAAFKDTGIAGRVSTIFADNYSRVYEISTVMRVKVRTGNGSLVPDGVTALDGEFTFNLKDEVTNATPEQVLELQRWIDHRPMPGLGALLIPDK